MSVEIYRSCDRCNTKWPYYLMNEFNFPTHSKSLARDYGWKFPDFMFRQDETCLCPDCLKEYLDWLNNGKERHYYSEMESE